MQARHSQELKKFTPPLKKFLTVVFAFDKLRPYLVLSKLIVYIDHYALWYILIKTDAKLYLIRQVLLLQAFDLEIKYKRESKNLVADHLSQLENNDDLSHKRQKLIILFLRNNFTKFMQYRKKNNPGLPTLQTTQPHASSHSGSATIKRRNSSLNSKIIFGRNLIYFVFTLIRQFGTVCHIQNIQIS